MEVSKSEFVFSKMKNGKPHFAIVNIEAEQSNENQVIENYSGRGFKSQGDIEEIQREGYDDWKEAVKRAIAFVLKRTEQNWKITINNVAGRIFTDTNPTIISYTTILALTKKMGIILDDPTRTKLDEMVFDSWNHGDLTLPDLENFSFESSEILRGEVLSGEKLPNSFKKENIGILKYLTSFSIKSNTRRK